MFARVDFLSGFENLNVGREIVVLAQFLLANSLALAYHPHFLARMNPQDSVLFDTHGTLPIEVDAVTGLQCASHSIVVAAQGTLFLVEAEGYIAPRIAFFRHYIGAEVGVFTWMGLKKIVAFLQNRAGDSVRCYRCRCCYFNSGFNFFFGC